MSTVREKAIKVLEDAAGFIRQGFTKKTWARSSNGYAVEPRSRLACAWCAMGAIERSMATASGDHEERMNIRAEIFRGTAPALALLGAGSNIPEYNDREDTTAEDVAGLLCKASELLKKA